MVQECLQALVSVSNPFKLGNGSSSNIILKVPSAGPSVTFIFPTLRDFSKTEKSLCLYLGLRAGFTLRREKWELIRRCWRDLELNYSHFERM